MLLLFLLKTPADENVDICLVFPKVLAEFDCCERPAFDVLPVNGPCFEFFGTGKVPKDSCCPLDRPAFPKMPPGFGC